MSVPAFGSSMSLLNCINCMTAASVDITNPNLPTMQLKWKVHDFCNTAQPSLADMFIKLRDWASSTGITRQYASSIGLVIEAVPAKFTATPGMNAPTTIPSTMTRPRPNPTRTDGLQWWQSTLTFNALIPTEYLAQIPSNWPYTEYGIMRKAGKTTSWPFVNPNATTSTVAWLYASVLWNPRPLVTPAAKKGDGGDDGNGKGKGMWQPGLEGWVPGFIYEIETVPVTGSGSVASGTTGSGSSKSSGMSTTTSPTTTATGAAALGYDTPVSTSLPGSASSSTTAVVWILAPPSSSSSLSTSLPPSQTPTPYTATVTHALPPTSTLDPIELPTGPDLAVPCLRCPDAGGRMLMQPTSSVDAQVTGIAEPEEMGLSHLWDVVQSMRSRLAG